MPDITIADGATEKIISQDHAMELLDPEGKFDDVLLDVSNADVRLVSGRDEEQAREGFPLTSGTVVTQLRPQGNAIYAFGDDGGGTSSVVHVHFASNETFTVGGGEVDL
jgi:hypothetical protein